MLFFLKISGFTFFGIKIVDLPFKKPKFGMCLFEIAKCWLICSNVVLFTPDAFVCVPIGVLIAI